MADKVIGIGTVLTNELAVRKNPVVDGRTAIKILSKGDTFDIYENIDKHNETPEYPTWFRTKVDGANAYVCGVIRQGNKVDTLVSRKKVGDAASVKGSSNSADTTASTPPAQTKPTTKSSLGFDQEIIDAMNSQTTKDSVANATMRLFGIPFQFMESVDPRVESVSTILGNQYVKNIISDAPILSIVPGIPKYVGHSEKGRNFISEIMNNVQEATFKGFEQINKGALSTTQLRYYDFEQQYLEYIKYVNLMCRVAAGFMGLNGRLLDGVELGSYSWQNYRFRSGKYVSLTESIVTSVLDITEAGIGDALKKFMTFAEYTGSGNKSGKKDMSDSLLDNSANSQITVDGGEGGSGWTELASALDTNNDIVQFYIDPSTFSEGLSNRTGESKIQGMVSTGEGFAKELQFVLNSSGASEDSLNAMEGFVKGATSSLNEIMDNSNSWGVLDVVKRVASMGNNIIRGETMIFPEIFNSSDYSKNYTIDINLKSPYGDRYSYYMNILVPLLHLVAFTAPRQSTANTYSSPFIIKAYLPGVFACMLGIVEDISINKNRSGDQMSVDGYPLDVQVSLRIKDLYADLMVSPSNDPAIFLTNTGLIDYLRVNCGLDMTTSKWAESAAMIFNNLKNYFTDIGQNIAGVFTTAIDNSLANFIRY